MSEFPCVCHDQFFIAHGLRCLRHDAPPQQAHEQPASADAVDPHAADPGKLTTRVKKKKKDFGGI